MSTLELARTVGVQTRREVNPTLYALEKEGKILKVGNVPAMWSLCSTTSTVLAQPTPSCDAVEGQVVAFLSRAGKACTALEVAKALGGKTRKEVNPHLYAMAKDGLITRVDCQGAPQWIVSSASSGNNSPGVPVQWSTVREPRTISSDNLEDQVFAALRMKSGIGQTALELTKCIGMNTTRHEIKLCLESLRTQGKVRCTATQPEQWLIDEVATQQNALSSTATVLGSVSDLTRNPVSKLSEYCQSKQLELSFPVISEHGPAHHKTFVIAAKFGTSLFKAESLNKKEAKRRAADLALQSIMASAYTSTIPLQSHCLSFSDRISSVTHSVYVQLQEEIHHPQPGRKVIAAFIMEDDQNKSMQVVSIGSGTQCVKGHNVSSEGLVVNDSHAEVVARRSLMRFFYREMLAKLANTSTIFVDSDTVGLVQVQDAIKFHLYISTAPCGDGGLFSRGDDENREPPPDNTHRPTLQNKKQGILRTKIEGGEGTIPVEENVQQTWDGILHGERLLTMSCSDKILRWNVLGLQGALLSQFIKPVYMSTLTLGSLHHHGHLSRAVCCRAAGIEGSLPTGYKLNHPTLDRTHNGDTMERHTDKTSNFSLNWALGDEIAELTDGVTGRSVSSTSTPKCSSRISKASLFSSFAMVCAKAGHSCSDTYIATKKASKSYQQAKNTLFELCKKKGYAVWVKKPEELEQFTIE